MKANIIDHINYLSINWVQVLATWSGWLWQTLPIKKWDEIYGYVTKGNGIVVHSGNCRNLNNMEKPRLLQLEWATNINRRYQASLLISSVQRNNLLADIINTISAQNVPLSSINAKNNESGGASVQVVVLVNNTTELQTLTVNLKKIEGIFNIERDIH